MIGPPHQFADFIPPPTTGGVAAGPAAPDGSSAEARGVAGPPSIAKRPWFRSLRSRALHGGIATNSRARRVDLRVSRAPPSCGSETATSVGPTVRAPFPAFSRWHLA